MCVCDFIAELVIKIYAFSFFIPVHDPFEYISFYGLRKHEKMLGKLVRHYMVLTDNYSANN